MIRRLDIPRTRASTGLVVTALTAVGLVGVGIAVCVTIWGDGQ